MSRTPCARSFFGIGSCPHSGMPGAPSGPALLEHEHRRGVHVEIRIVDARRHVVVALEDDGASRVRQQRGIGGGRLHHRAARREVAVQHDQPVGVDERVARGRG